jgi:hypothetical protein
MFPSRPLLLTLSATFLVAMAALQAQAETTDVNPGRHCSASGVYCVELYEVDLQTFGIVENVTVPALRLLQRSQDGTFLQLRMLDVDAAGLKPLLTDDGRTIVLPPSDFYGARIVTILGTDGVVAATVAVADVVDVSDLLAGEESRPRWSIRRSEAGEERLVLSLRSTLAGGENGPRGELELSLPDGRLLTPKRAIYPPLRIFARAAVEEVPSSRVADWTKPKCGAGPMLFGARGLLPIDAETFLAAAVEKPVAEYPIISWKARVAGTAYVEAIVDESGRVACARVNGLPFGIDTAAEESVLRWRFRPFEWKRVPVKAIGRVALQFGRFEHEEWQRMNAAH